MLVWVAGWVVVLAAAAAAVVVTLQNLRGARGPAERRFVLWNCLGLWTTSLASLALAHFLGSPWRYIVVGIYAVGIIPFMYWAAMRRQLIRRAEELKHTPPLESP